MAGSRLGPLLSEIRRRKVIRVALTSAAASWVAVEVAVTVAPLLGLPE